MKVKKAAKKTSTRQGNRKEMKSGNGNSGVKKQQVKSARAASKPSAEKKTAKSNGNGVTGIRKQYLKTGDVCSVTFRLPKDAAPDAKEITVVGDFNDWDVSNTPMKKLRNGDFSVTLKLPRGREYRFRYLIDAKRWENDWCADEYVPNAFGCDDSLVKV